MGKQHAQKKRPAGERHGESAQRPVAPKRRHLGGSVSLVAGGGKRLGGGVSLVSGGKPRAALQALSGGLTPPPPSFTAAAFLAEHEITIHEAGAPPPCTSLGAAPFPARLVGVLMRQGFSAPSAVQAASWPLAMAGRDVLAIAKTGSGKTLGCAAHALASAHPRSLAARARAPL